MKSSILQHESKTEKKQCLTFTEIFERRRSADTVLQSRWQKSVCLEAIYRQASYFHGAFHFTV